MKKKRHGDASNTFEHHPTLKGAAFTSGVKLKFEHGARIDQTLLMNTLEKMLTEAPELRGRGLRLTKIEVKDKTKQHAAEAAEAIAELDAIDRGSRKRRES